MTALVFIDIFNHAPWVVNLCLTEQIPVVPFPHLFYFVRKSIGNKHCFRFFLSEAETLSKFPRPDGNDIQMVQTRKYTFFADTQTPRDDCPFQCVVRLQCRFKKRTDKTDHFIVKSRIICIFQWHIILIQKGNYTFSVMLFQIFGQRF